MIARVLRGESKEILLNIDGALFSEPKVANIANGQYRKKSTGEVFGTGYCVESLEAALWCFHNTDSFESAVLEAANLGDDADTTAAIVGQLAGAYYGSEQIPKHWLAKLHMRTEIEATALALLASIKTQ
jgi:ADP-ribosyl-[dinitrogen reductase] hydrolase